MPADCLFCRKVADLAVLPADVVVWRFPHSIALLGPWQFYHGYCVLISREHATELSGLSDIVRRDYLDEMCLLARAIERGFHPHKLNYELLGNQVSHLHWHLFPRSASDVDRFWPVWRALEVAERDPTEKLRLETGPTERTATVAALRQQLTQLGAPTA